MGSELRQHQRPHRPGVSSQAIACQNLASPSLTLSLSRLHLTNVWYTAIFQGTFLVVEGSGLRASTARGPSLIPGQGTKILQAVRYSQKKKAIFQNMKQTLESVQCHSPVSNDTVHTGGQCSFPQAHQCPTCLRALHLPCSLPGAPGPSCGTGFSSTAWVYTSFLGPPDPATSTCSCVVPTCPRCEGLPGFP